VHLFNGLNTTANHGDPASEVPLREEIVPIAGIRVRLEGQAPTSFKCEPGARPVEVKRDGNATFVMMPPLLIHQMLIADF